MKAFGEEDVTLDPTFRTVPKLSLPYGNISITDGMKLSFNYNDATDGKEIVFLLNTTYKGYASFGFGNLMKDTDMMIVLFNGNDEPTVTSAWAKGHSVPINYKTQNAKLLEYMITPTYSLVKFSRKLTPPVNDEIETP